MTSMLGYYPTITLLFTLTLVAGLRGAHGTINPSFDNIDKMYAAVVAHTRGKKSFALEVRKQPNKAILEWSIVDVQPYEPLMHDQDDAFCGIINQQSPARMVFADDKYIGIFPLRNMPTTCTRIMVIPYEHCHSVAEISQAELCNLLKRGAQAAMKLGSSESYMLRTNRGLPLQVVPHLHLHVFAYHKPRPRTIFELITPVLWNGRQFNDIEQLVQKAQQSYN